MAHQFDNNMKDQKLPSSIQQENLPQELGAASLVVASTKNKHFEDLPDECVEFSATSRPNPLWFSVEKN